MDMTEQSMKQYERIRKGYPRLFSDAQKITKLIIKAAKEDMEPSETAKYLKTLKKIESRKKGYTPVPELVINIFIDAKLTNDEERNRAKQYYMNVVKAEHEEEMLKEYISYLIRKI